MKNIKMKVYTFVFLFFSSSLYANGNLQQAATSAVTTYTGVAVMNVVSGVAYKGLCSSANAAACVGAGVAFAQALMAARQGKNTDNDVRIPVTCTGAFCNDDDGNGDTPPPPGGGGRPTTPPPTTTTGTPRLPGTGSPTLDNLVILAETELDDLENQGYEFTRDGEVITTPDGKKINLAALSSPSGLKAAGFADKDISEFIQARDKLANSDKANKLLSQIASELEGGGGGKRNANGNNGNNGAGIDYSKLFASFNKKDSQDGSRGLAGLEKKLGTDSIGLAQDNIFKMIHRRYNIKQPDLAP